MDQISNILEPFRGVLGEYSAYGELLLSVLGLFAALATVVPHPKRNSCRAYKIFYVIITWLACNFGKAKNAQKHDGGPCKCQG